MRLVKNKIEHNGSGTVTLLPEEPEDMVFLPLIPRKIVKTYIDKSISLTISGMHTTSYVQAISSVQAQSAESPQSKIPAQRPPLEYI